MKKLLLFFVMMCIITISAMAQVGINDDGSPPDPAAMLDVKSPDKGLLIPRVELVSETDPIIETKPVGLMVWNTSTTGNYPVPGFYFWDGTDWIKIANGNDMESTLSDADNDTYITVEVTPDEDTIRFVVAGQEVMKHDGNTLHMTDPNNNVFVGNHAGENNLDGEFNLAFGGDALKDNTTGDANIALGGEALERNTAGNGNIAVGNRALFRNDNGYGNTALGSQAGYNNVSGDNNVFLGKFAGYNESGNNTLYIENSQATPATALIYGEFDNDQLTFNGNVGVNNLSPGAPLDVNGHIWQSGTGQSVFLGEGAGENDDLTDNRNTLSGYHAGQVNITGQSNSFYGYNSGSTNTSSSNSFFGAQSGMVNTSGSLNTFLGSSAGRFNNTGNRNTFVGSQAGYSNNTGSGNVLIGYNAGAGERNSNKLFIENSNADSTAALIYGDFEEDRLTVNGNMGINNTDPTEALDVDGSVKIKDGTEGDNKILVSDSDGKASWKKVTEVSTGLMSPNFPNGLEGIIPVTVAVNDASSYQVPAKVTFYILNVYSNNANNLQIDGLPITYGWYNYSDGTNPATRLGQPLLVGTGSVVNGSDANDIILNGYLVGNGTGGSEQPWECGDILVDERDGQSYPTVQIGTQCWMAKNLNIGTRIEGVNDMADNGIMEKYCHDDDPANCAVYGGLYQWDEMMQYVTTEGVQGICMDGWHLPTDAEWMILEEEVESTTGVNWNTTGWRGTDAGGNLKEPGTTHWTSPNTGATNSSGFTGLPGGYRLTDGSFFSLSNYASFWSSSENGSSAWGRYLSYNYAQVLRDDNSQAYGFSVRCVRD